MSLTDAEIDAYGLTKLPAGSDIDYQAMMMINEKTVRWGDMEVGFYPIFEACRRYTMTSVERMYALYKAVEYVVKAGVPGNIVECGVWRGGSMMLAARTLLKCGDASRILTLYDTFEGHPKPDREVDISIFGENAADVWHEGWAAVSVGEVLTNMESTGYPRGRMLFVKGKVEDTLPKIVDESWPIAIARLDTDWYAGAKVELEVLWPRISSGGVLIIDDYGSYKGQRKAVDEYFADKPAVLMQRIDYSCRTIIKP